MALYDTCFSALTLINSYLEFPALILFLGTGVFLTLKTGFIQIRAFPRFIALLTQGVRHGESSRIKTINPFHALLSAMATTIGMGNIVGPSMAIAIGGPGALLWLLVYIFFGSVTKFTEVTFSVFARKITPAGDVMGGPAQYLKLVSPKLAAWYAGLTIFLFTGWSGIQVNTLASIWAQEGISRWITGLVAVAILLAVVLGGVKRIGFFASRIVPLKFLVYITFVLIILFQHPAALWVSIKLVFSSAFHPPAALGGFAGATLLSCLREGIYKGIFITESGVGTASIAHALSDAKNPVDQGILAMFSGIADMFLCTLSGLLTLVTGVWLSGKLNNTLVYEAFKSYFPVNGGQYILVVAILLFVITALIGNTFNGSQSFASLTGYKYVSAYYFMAALIAFLGALADVPFLWKIMDVVLVLVAIPNLMGIIYLSFSHAHVVKIK